MKRRLTRENAAEAVLLPLAFFLIFVLPVLVGEAPPVLTASGLAGFVAAHMAGLGKRKKDAGPGTVTLEPLSTAHLPGLERLWSDPAVIRYTSIGEPCDAGAAAHRFYRLRSCQTALSGPVIFAVLRDGRFCGVAGCPPVDAEKGTFGLFYQLQRSVWGQGIGKTAARLALDELYRLAPSAVVYADAAAENTASVRILEHLGFARTAVHPGAFQRDGRALDIWEYTLRPDMKEEERL